MFKEFKENGLNEQLGNLNIEMTIIKNENILELKSKTSKIKKFIRWV